MSKYIPSSAIVFLGLCILIGSWIIGQSLKESEIPEEIQVDQQPENIEVDVQEQSHRYDMVSPNETNLIILDRQTGDYYRKFIDPTEGPTEWELQLNPFDSDTTSRSY